jgi:hypothetical protein
MWNKSTRREYLRALIAAGTLLVLSLFVGVEPGYSVVLDEENRIDITLDDGTSVTLFGEATSTPGVKSQNYYYLPANLRLATRPDSGVPEFLFLKFTTEAKGGATGALMHFLMVWGLTPAQEADLRAKLKAKQSGAELMGAVPLEAEGDSGSFQIISATLTDKGLASTLLTSGKAPLVPGGRAAASARLTADGAQLMAATLEKTRSVADLSIGLNYVYQTLVPAAKGTITFDWSKLQQEGNSFRADYARKQTGSTTTEGCFLVFCSSSTEPTYSYSYNEVQNQFKYLLEKQIVRVQFDELVSDERVAKIREAFFQYFLNSLTDAGKVDTPPAPPSDKDKDKPPEVRVGDRYTFRQSAFKSAFERKTQIFRLDYRMSVRHPYSIVGNLASWYDGVRDNPKCVYTVNLNDPFFEHRDISFILDADVKDMFQSYVNYVTVNVRKTRSGGHSFSDRVLIDQKYVTEKGINATVTYARGDDTNPDLYEYQAQWSFHGGVLYPPDPPWQRGTWEGVTLAAPIESRLIEVEGDLAALKASDITRVTVQLRYPRLGEEIEENIPISPVQNQPLVSKKIAIDRGAKGYVYRLVIDHKTEGKMALPWSAKVGDDYVFASIPAELLVKAELMDAAKKAAETAAAGTSDKVLDKFKELLGGGPR